MHAGRGLIQATGKFIFIKTVGFCKRQQNEYLIKPMRKHDHRLRASALLALERYPINRGGFTLIELIVVVLLLGILSIYAAPRFLNPSDIDAFGFHGESLSYLRYAQRTAIAQRRTVCVEFSLSSVALTISSSAATPDCSSAEALIGPKGESSPVLIAARSGVVFESLPTNFNFNGLGQPITSAGNVITQSLPVRVRGVSKFITVEAATGYVHD